MVGRSASDSEGPEKCDLESKDLMCIREAQRLNCMGTNRVRCVNPAILDKQTSGGVHVGSLCALNFTPLAQNLSRDLVHGCRSAGGSLVAIELSVIEENSFLHVWAPHYYARSWVFP